jgi:hypothetical protein
MGDCRAIVTDRWGAASQRSQAAPKPLRNVLLCIGDNLSRTNIKSLKGCNGGYCDRFVDASQRLTGTSKFTDDLRLGLDDFGRRPGHYLKSGVGRCGHGTLQVSRLRAISETHMA